MKRFGILTLLLPVFCYAEPPQFSVEQTKACSAYAEDISTFNEMRKDGLPLSEAKNIYKKAPHGSEFTLKDIDDLYNLREKNSAILYGYFEVVCYNKIAKFENKPFKDIRPELSACEGVASSEMVIDCATKKTIELTLKSRSK